MINLAKASAIADRRKGVKGLLAERGRGVEGRWKMEPSSLQGNACGCWVNLQYYGSCRNFEVMRT